MGLLRQVTIKMVLELEIESQKRLCLQSATSLRDEFSSYAKELEVRGHRIMGVDGGAFARFTEDHAKLKTLVECLENVKKCEADK